MARILVLEDSDPLRRILVRILSDEGHEVIESPTGFAVYDAAILDGVDLLITDLVMPRVDGLDAIRTARAARADLQIIAMSGGSANFVQDYLGVAEVFGANSVLQKPFEPESLISVVNGALAA